MGSAGDGLSSSDVGKSSFVNFEDDSGRVVVASKGIVGQGDIGNFIDDGVCQDNSGSFEGVRIGASAGVGASMDGLGVDVDDGRGVSGGIFEDGEF